MERTRNSNNNKILERRNHGDSDAISAGAGCGGGREAYSRSKGVF